MHTTEPGTGGGVEAITTIEDLGRYLQGLRGKWRVTQESLSTKTGAITERKISRSRISEIENAKRDRVTERELRVYLRGLKCTPRHIDQVVQVLAQCTEPAAKESPANPDATSTDATSPATLEAHPARHGVAFVAATALVVVALAGLGVGLSLRGESGDRPTPPSSPTALLAPHSAQLIADDATDLGKAATFPAGARVRVNQSLSAVSNGGTRLGGRGAAADRDATQQLSAVMPVLRCGVPLAGQHRPATAPQCPGGAVAGPGSTDGRGQGIAIDPHRMGADPAAMHGALLGPWEGPRSVDD